MSDVVAPAALANLISDFNAFASNAGKRLFDMHSAGFVRRSLQIVLQGRPTCSPNMVHTRVLQSKATHELLPLLVIGSDCQVLAPSQRLVLDGSAADLDNLRQRAQYTELEGFRTFAEVAKLEAVAVDGVVNAMKEAQPVRVAEALTLLRIGNFAAEVVMLASALQCGYLLPKATGEQISKEDALGYWAFVLRALQQSLTGFEELLASDSAIAIEELGYHFGASIVVYRGWREALSVFAGGALRELLGTWADLLGQATTTCRSRTPSWQVAFATGKLDLPLAERVLANRLQPLAAAHNDLHGLLQAICVSKSWADSEG